MSFQLVYHSQQDSKWKSNILGFGDPGDTIGYVGCALTSMAMLLSGHGCAETPKTLNQKLKNVSGFAGAGIRWGAVTQLYPQITLKSFIPCSTSDAPLAQIDAAIAAGQPAIVMVDSTPAPGLLTHWVVLYARKGNDYLMLDPWPYQPDVTKETLLMPRYSQGKTLQRSIMHVILFENTAADGSISTPGGIITPQPAPTPAPSSGAQARVKAEVIWGLNVRSSIDTSSLANVVEMVNAGAALALLEADGESKVGAVNQWVRVRTPSGKEGFAAAWYLEKVAATTPAPTPQPDPAPVTPPEPQPEPQPAPTPVTYPTTRLKVAVKSSAKVYDRASVKGKVLSTQAKGAVLACLETTDAARPKVGVKGQWLNVRYATAKKGYVQAELVKLAK